MGRGMGGSGGLRDQVTMVTDEDAKLWDLVTMGTLLMVVLLTMMMMINDDEVMIMMIMMMMIDNDDHDDDL